MSQAPDISGGRTYCLLSPSQAGRLVGFSARHVDRLCDGDQIEHIGSGRGRLIPVDAIVWFAARRGLPLLVDGTSLAGGADSPATGLIHSCFSSTVCRWLAYSGTPIRLDELLVKRDHSL